MADAGVLDVDEDFVGSGLGDGDLLVFERAADLRADLGPLHLGDGEHGERVTGAALVGIEGGEGCLRSIN